MLRWRPIPGFSSYEVSDEGEIIKDGKRIAQHLSDSGYKKANLTSDDGKRRKMLVHRIVLLTFVGEPPTPKHHGAHGPGGKHDNSVANLSWKTQPENEADKPKRGGGGFHNVPDAFIVAYVRELVSRGDSLSAVAKRFGFHRSTASRYVRGIRRAS